jgi:hypothetical protein
MHKYKQRDPSPCPNPPATATRSFICPDQTNPRPNHARGRKQGKCGHETLTSSDRRYSSMASMYGATAACAAPASGRFGSGNRVTPSASRRFLASASARVLGFVARGAEPPSPAFGALIGSSARALRFPSGLLGGGCGGAAGFSLLPIASDPGVWAGNLEGFSGGDQAFIRVPWGGV